MKRSGFKKKPRKINLKNKLWDIFSQYIRQREADENGMVSCISCENVQHWKEMHAGHYISQSLGLSTLFDERNVHAQCVSCNYFRGGNLRKYALKLRERYGESILEDLDKLQRTHRKISPPEYLELIEHYKEKLKGKE